jgi:hypothetical protein
MSAHGSARLDPAATIPPDCPELDLRGVKVDGSMATATLGLRPRASQGIGEARSASLRCARGPLPSDASELFAWAARTERGSS